METDIERIMSENSLVRVHFPITWMVGPIIYAIGLLLSTATGNLARFLTDYPWLCLVTVITMATCEIPPLTERHGKYTISIRTALNITDEEFKALLERNMRRLMGGRNLVFGLTFLPGLLWAFTQRLWWREYAQPALFDAYYMVILVYVLMNELSKGSSEGEYTPKGPVGVGSTLHYVGTAGGSQAEWDMEITEFVKDRRVSMRTIGASKFKMHGSHTLEPTAKGTKLTDTMDYELPYSILGKIVDKLKVGRDIEKIMEKNLNDTRKALEA